jgi:AraC-like DNA-binding protein
MWAAAGAEATSTVIHFLPELWGAEFWQLPEVQKVRRLLAKAGRGLRFTGRTAWKVGRAIEDLAARPAHDFESFIGFLGICERLVRAPHYSLNALPVEARVAERDPRLQQVLQWIQRRAAEPITQQQAAAEVGMSPATFSRWFKGRVGCVFHRHLNGLRVAMVCARLSSGQESITEAAFQCGYNSLANFNRRFREITGFTPSEFRLQTRRMQQDSGKPFVMRLDGNGAVRITPPTGTAGMIGWGRSLNGRAAKREHRPAAKRA